jgi:hypothetical protein
MLLSIPEELSAEAVAEVLVALEAPVVPEVQVALEAPVVTEEAVDQVVVYFV